MLAAFFQMFLNTDLCFVTRYSCQSDGLAAMS